MQLQAPKSNTHHAFAVPWSAFLAVTRSAFAVLGKVLEKTFQFIAVIVSICAIYLTLEQYRLSVLADKRDAMNTFQSLVIAAQGIYCATDDGSESYDLKMYVDRANKLVPYLQDELTASDYYALATVAYGIWPDERLIAFARRAFDDPDILPIDRWALQLLLAHSSYHKYSDTKKPEDLRLARKYIEIAVTESENMSNADMRAQCAFEACSDAGKHELLNSLDGADHFFERARAFSPGFPTTVNTDQIRLAFQSAFDKGLKPRPKCPSQLSLPPDSDRQLLSMLKPILPEDNNDSPNDPSPTLHPFPPTPTDQSPTPADPRDKPPLVPTDNLQRDSAAIEDADMTPTLNSPDSVRSMKYVVRIFNYTNHAQQPIVDGIRLPPILPRDLRSVTRFGNPSSVLTLGRVGGAKTTRLPYASLFYEDGQQIEPIVFMTHCCFK